MTTTPSPAGRTAETIAGRILLDDVLAALRAVRPLFHSEADLQHSFARALWELAPEVGSRLEVPRRGRGKNEHLDLLCVGPLARTAIEFKYVTRRWSGTIGLPPEVYQLRKHGAPDVARRDFVRDLERLERFCDREDQNGLALLVTNEASLWRPQVAGRAKTNDDKFRIHEGRTLRGTLLWAGGAYIPNTQVLRGVYPLTWRPYADLGGVDGEFRCLAVFITPVNEASGARVAAQREVP
ncbi:hypothetical protein OIE69_44195 (plasmid) [Actinacidiphila glaucinigra]|uniref:hypothetical protein n=1 Tax=Actinacidiphila glaucinigra TaxID=235986 RepID=UPI002DDBA69C|nr:hypothetical protein [Actinacidiphila glaucinigra]WSD65906.1 hypothetical protein OIE69_44195 [Actinacidiphila glaucinigra]